MFSVHNLQDRQFQKHVMPSDHGEYILESDPGIEYIQSHPLDIDDDFCLYQKEKNEKLRSLSI